MYKIAVLGDYNSIYGFAALGLDTFPVEDPAEGKEKLNRLAAGEYAVIYITEQLAAQLQVRGCDITRSALAKIEVGQRHIYLDELRLLRIILNVSYDDLLEPSTV